MNTVKCCLCGKKHENKEQMCEDSCSELLKNNVLAVAVADGAGDEKYTDSGLGAQTVSDVLCRLLVTHFDELIDIINEFEIRKIVETVCKKELKKVADTNGIEAINSMSSTALAVAVKGTRGVAIHIGDGLIGRNVGESLEALTKPQNGEFAGSTFFITADDSFQYIQIVRFYTGNTSQIFLMSDGLADGNFNDINGTFSEGLKRILEISKEDNGEEKVKDCLLSNIINYDSSSDDTTIVVINL